MLLNHQNRSIRDLTTVQCARRRMHTPVGALFFLKKLLVNYSKFQVEIHLRSQFTSRRHGGVDRSTLSDHAAAHAELQRRYARHDVRSTTRHTRQQPRRRVRRHIDCDCLIGRHSSSSITIVHFRWRECGDPKRPKKVEREKRW
jgi:hypothetical protein